MALRKFIPSNDSQPPAAVKKPLNFSIKIREKPRFADTGLVPDVDVDLREVYFLIMHFLSSGPCQRTCGQFWNELLENRLLPRRYHAWYSRNNVRSGDENDDGVSFPLNYNMLTERYPHVAKDHLVKLLKQLILSRAPPSRGMFGGNAPNASDVPTLMGSGSFSLLSNDRDKVNEEIQKPPLYMRWPHTKVDQFRGLCLREIGGGFARHHRAPSIRTSCYAIAQPSTMFQKMHNVKKLRGHRYAVYCATLDRSGRYVITGSDDRLVKIWSMETAYCLASCRGHEGDITDLAVSSNNAVVASSSNDCIIRVWRLPDGQPISVLRGHTGAVTAITFNPRPGFVYQLLSSSDDGTCRIWDARSSQLNPRVYVPRPSDVIVGRNNGTASGVGAQSHQIFCCAFNSSGTIFVTGSSDTLARVWSASKPSPDDGDQPTHEIDVLSGHENDVNYVQFSGCAMTSRFMTSDTFKEENVPKFKNSWFTHDNIVTCSRDGSAIIWSPRSRRSNAKACRWARAYHLKVPPPPMPPQPLRGGPRQRILPTPRGVNMIIWSLDNRFVLAAIMDCRICVWNASDGSLVHSLTGHSESTYVLDVHPFNPRIAMSAGYDGRTIVWDIWEGKPIKIHEISRFKLVDGKFSPDGTSIILSDDVGQLYIVNTGQGESQKDARYDQFFLGDYRPLMQDTYGNVIDQETQLSTFRRNMQDLLCDSGMIPYPEPYQSSFQKRRLGALGHEWNPNPQTLATGPDFTVDPEFQMLPLADLDIMAEPVPEFADIMDWEPEIEIHSDDNDSEYNVPEDYVGGGDQGNVSVSSSDEDSRGNEDDGDTDGDDDDDGQLDHIRRSKRKKKKSETEVMTSSGRRVKRRNLDEAEGNSLRNNRARKLKTGGRKASRKKSSKSKSKSRPKRAAALNALNLFSKITGTSTDGEEDEEGSEVETSESGSDLQDSDIESNVSDKYTQTEQRRRLKGKETSLDDSEEFVERDCQVSTENRARLVLKLPNKIRDRALPESDKHDDFAGPSSKAPQENGCEDSKQTLDDKHFRNGNSEGDQLDKVENLNLTGSYISGKIKWVGIRPRSDKRRRLSRDLSGRLITVGDAVNLFSDSQDGVDHERVFGTGGETSKSHDMADDGQKCNFLPENTDNPQNVSRGPEMESPATKDENGTCNNSLHDSTVPEDATTNGVDSNQRDTDTSKDSTSTVKDSGEPRSRSDKMFSVVYRRSKHKGASNLSGIASSSSDQKHPSVELDSCEGPSNGSKKPSISSSDHMAEDDNTKLNLEPESSSGCKLNLEPESSSGYKLRNALNSSGNGEKSSRFSHEEWGSSSKVTIGLRSARNRRGNYNNVNEMSPMESRKLNKSSRKGMWLMLSTHEEGSRYIPQLGDEVAYLRQGHQEYLEHSRSRETPPWTSTKGNVRDVEFCRVEKLDYSSLPGSGESCCKMTLVFVDPTSCVYLKSFKMTLPEMTGFPDFLVEKTRYKASIQRNWTHRDKCKVWWKNDGEEDGSWWDGRILTVKPKSPDFMDSPWERYTVQYKSDPAETHLHSPWELFDVDTLWENPHIDEENKFSVQSSFAKLEKSSKPPQDRFAIIKLRQLSQKPNFTNRFPVPISLDLIECRLENDYYRSLEAVKHDFEVMLSNAEQYLGNKSDFTAKLKRFRDWLERTFPSS